MKILENILKNWMEVPENILELTNQKIIEVDDFGYFNQANDLVIGHVLTCDDHPNSDHLHVTTVDLGSKIVQIVCGADNVAKGQYVVVAQVGTILPGDFLIKSAKIRGIESNGMICSLKELGFEDKFIPLAFKEGIYYFDDPQEIGRNALEVLALDGFCMTLGLTPNRGDLLSHMGFAYDLCSMTHLKMIEPTYKISTSDQKNLIDIDIQTEGCTTYYARYFDNVVIKESPWWLKSALIASDIKPINNIVDISNYVLIEYGTPLHMFDALKFKNHHIVVKDAKKGEEVVTLDEVKRTLEADDVVITNGDLVIAIGGVMGCLNTAIDDQTTQVVLEAAHFDPKRILNTSKRLNLRSDSSLRFERGVDQSRVFLGMQRATELILELAEATLRTGDAHQSTKTETNPTIELPTSYFNQMLGITIDEALLLTYFKQYNYTVKKNKDVFYIQAPSYRKDIWIAADILEEVARMHGFNQIPMTPIKNAQLGKLSNRQKRLRSIRHQLAHFGLNEVITYSLRKNEEVETATKLGESISILYPLSEDMKTLRQTLVPGLLDVISYNQARQNDNVSIFEIGHVFAKDIEITHLCFALSGAWHHLSWQKAELKVDFYVVKGILESLLSPMGIELSMRAANINEMFHPYRQAEIMFNEEVIGLIAELHPNELKKRDIKETFVVELNLEPILVEPKHLSYQPISKYPNITRDLAIVVDESVLAKDLFQLIKQTAAKNLVSVELFDVYQGSHIQEGRKSMAFSLIFNDLEKTLSSLDVDQLMKKIVNRLTFTYQAEIRK